jgi:hypothetical protein
MNVQCEQVLFSVIREREGRERKTFRSLTGNAHVVVCLIHLYSSLEVNHKASLLSLFFFRADNAVSILAGLLWVLEGYRSVI